MQGPKKNMSQHSLIPDIPSLIPDLTTSLDSLTARVYAALRMMETVKPEPFRLIHDPYAGYFVSQKSLSLARNQDEFVPVLGRQVILEARFIDHAMTDALRAGIRQVVLLGAGHDCRALRLAGSCPSDTVFFEVDRPRTLRYKRHILLKYLLRLSSRIRHVPHDLAQSSFWDVLQAAGYAEQAPSLFVLEGVVPYLSEPVVPGLLSGIRTHSCHGSLLVMTCVNELFIEVAGSNAAFQPFIQAYAGQGETLQFGRTPKEMERLLTECGLTQVELHPLQDIERLYSSRRTIPDLGYVTVARH
jgi:methyltransferase (TIGR00027 family)